MFKKDTVFILGAGASKPYGYPLGYELVENIINNTNQDKIYLPILESPKSGINYYWNNNNGKIINRNIENPYLLDDFIDFFQKTQTSVYKFSDGIPYRSDPEPGFVRRKINNINHIDINLYQIKEFFDLKQSLIDFNPISIDAFLRDNKSHETAGKIMIIYSLLKCECTTSQTAEIKNNENSDEKNNDDKWYGHLLNDLLSGCRKPEDLLENKLTILTFNYDVSLDFYLYDKLNKTEFFKGNKIYSTYID